MNKLRYRVIFNKTRGLLMAVSELGRSHGTGPCEGGAPAAAASPLAAARLQPLAFAVLVLAGAELLAMPAAHAQIVADPAAPRAQQAVVVNTANGLPQVNITTPSAAGVSRNTYSQFDVNKPGAILNNARNDVQTQLGGWVQRNPNLATGTARVILNEVNSANPSFLRGYVEVAGDRAQVIVANPSGVTCDGCGFINASRTTLTTGTAVMNNGNLDGFVVRRGTVTVQGDGLDASQSDYTHIIARAVRINAGLWSRELRITTGANRVDADNQVLDKLDGEGDAPSLSLDVAQLGGMYANKIVLVGTEAGVGVRNAGSIGAAAGEVRISAAGRIENSGKIQSTQTASIDATGLDNRGGKLQAASDIEVRAGSGTLDNAGGLIDTRANVSLQAASLGNQDTGGSDQGIHGANISVQADSIANQRGTMLASQTQTLRAERSLDNSGGAISAGGSLSVSGGSLVLTNRGGQIQTNAALKVQAASITNTDTMSASQGLQAKSVALDADVIDNRRGKLRADDALTVTAASTVDNSGGAISATAGVTIHDRVDAPATRQLAVRNDGGLIETANAVDIKAASLSNTDTDGTSQGLRASRINVDADRIGNMRGAILANDSIALTGSGTLDNSAGTISAGGALRVADRNADSASNRNLAITNTGGKLDADSTSIDAAGLGGDGQVLSQQATTVKLSGDFSNSGTVRSNGSIDIDSAGTLNNDGLMQASTLLKIKARTIMNGATGTLVGTGLQLNATDAHTLVNRGLIDGQETVIVTQALRNLGTGRIYGDHVAIAATTVDNEAETVNGVTSAPVIAARERLDIGAENVNNREHAILFSAGDMAIGGALDADNRATGQAGSVNNNSATIEAQGTLDLAARNINNTNEHFSTEMAEVSREQKREFQYSGSATRYDDSQVAIINDESDDMWLRDANGKPSIKLGNDFNRYDYTRVIQESRVSQSDPARIWSGQGLRIRADVLNNDKSQIIAGGSLTGTIGTLNNTEVPGQRIITDSGTAYHFYNIEKKGRDEQGVSRTAYYPGQVVQAISLTPTVYQENTAAPGSGTQVGRLNNASMSNGVRVPGVALAIGGGGAIRLPNNSLFSINTNPALHYLVQSDPRFTSYRTWLSSDYMLQQLNVDPTLTQKRLHAAAGALAGGFDGALGATTASVAMPKIDKLIQGLDLPEALRQGLAQAVAAGLGGVVGGSSGVIAGVHVEANNRQLHKKEINWIEENKKKAARYLTEKLEREVSPEEAAAYLTLAGEGNVDDVYQRDNANNRLGSQASSERQLYNGAKQFILMNAVGSFTDDRGVTQKLFTAAGNDFYNVKVNSKLRNDKEYRDFLWKTLGENLLPDNPTAAERAEYDERQKIRLDADLKSAALGMIPAILAGMAVKIATTTRQMPGISEIKTTSPSKPDEIAGREKLNNLGPRPGALIGSTEHLSEAEKGFVLEMLQGGRNVEIIPSSNIGRSADFLIDGKKYELKTMANVANQTADGLSKSLSSTIMNARGQSENVIVDARGQPGMTAEIAERGIVRAFGRDKTSGDKIREVTVITSSGTVYVAKK